MKEREENPSPLEKMREKLYAPGSSFDIQPSSLSARSSTMQHTWEKEAPHEAPLSRPRFKLSGSALFLIGAVVFFIVAGLVAFFLVVQGGRSVSNDRISVTVENPPTSIAGGDTVSLFVVVQNRNPAALTNARLLIDFPEGTYSATDATAPLAHEVENLGTIAAGDIAKRTIRATLFGEANQGLTIPMTLEYETEGSTSVFEKKQSFNFTIGTSPVSVNVTSLSEVSSGQPITFDVSVRSNASTPIDNLAVHVDYPFGFSVTKTDPKPAGSLFILGTLAPGQEKKISITGTLTGQDKDERVFHFAAGTAKGDGSETLGTSFITKEDLVTITRPFIAVDLSLDGSKDDTVVASPGKSVQGVLSWVNTLSSQIQDAELSVKLSGDALDKSSISTSGGFYRSSDTTILFTRDTTPGLRTLQPGDTGTGSFSFAAKQSSALTSLHNPSITVAVSIAGRRVGETGVAEEVTSTINRVVQVASQLALTTSAPASSVPTPDVETMYTVRFQVDNGVNAIADTVVKATLPSYVRFVSSTSGVVYNDSTREVSWTIGDLAAHAGGKVATFQIAFLPSSSQVGSAPVIVATPTLTGFDRFVQKTVTATNPSIDSGLRVK